MDEGGGEGVGDQMDQFHRNEAISAVADEGFLGEEEEDDDFEDLYNDVNVGESFLQYQRKSGDASGEFRAQNQNDAVADKKESGSANNSNNKKLDLGSSSNVATAPAPNPGESDFRVSGNLGFRGPDGQGHPIVPSGSTGGGGGGLRVELGRGSGNSCKMNELEGQSRNLGNNVGISNTNNNNGSSLVSVQGQQSHGGGGAAGGSIGNVGNEGLMRQGPAQGGGVGVGNVNGVGNGIGAGGVGGGVVGSGVGGAGGGGGGTILFVGDLHWWTTDAELEAELVKYGPVKEVKFFDEKASGKSKGYCQVEFYDPSTATACKDGMNGHVFNGRPCVVAFASPFTVKRMGEAQVNRNQQASQQTLVQARRGQNDAAGKNVGGSNIATGGNYQGGDNRGYGRGNWGRGNQQGMGNRGPVGPRSRGAGGMGGRCIMGNGGNGFGQGIGVTPPLLHPQSMMGQGFDPAFGGPMGRMGTYGGFPGAPTPPFSGVLSSFPPVGGVGLPGVAPHVNPAFFGRGMPMNGMGMMAASGVDGPNMGMWSDPSMGGWVGEEHGGGRAAESSYGEEAASDHQFGEVNHDRGGWQNPMKEKDRTSERDWSGSSDKRYRDDRDSGYDRDIPREKDMVHDHDWSERRPRDDRDIGRERSKERDRDRERSRDRERNRDRDRDRDRDRYREDRDGRYVDHHRYRDRDAEHDDGWDRGRSSRTHSKSRISQEEDHRSRSRDADYGKRRRLTSE